MIIDLQTQVWTDSSQTGDEVLEWRRRDDSEPWSAASADAHQRAMRCVDVAVVMGFDSRHLGVKIASETVASFVSKAPNRRIGFAGVDPMRGGAIEEIDRAVSLGLVGVTISPGAQNFHPAHSAALQIYERCEQLGLPVLVRSAGILSSRSILDYADPTAFDEIARSFPRLKIVLGGLGFPWINETLLLALRHRSLYTDLAGVTSRPWQLYNSLVLAFELGVMDKILFASNFPQTTPERAIERIYSMNAYSHGTELPSVPRQQLRAIVERDSLSALGLERPGGASISGGIGRGADPGETWSPTLSDMMGGRGGDLE